MHQYEEALGYYQRAQYIGSELFGESSLELKVIQKAIAGLPMNKNKGNDTSPTTVVNSGESVHHLYFNLDASAS
jgi:hypothetical protein